MSMTWFISRIARQFGIDISSLFYHFLFREIARSIKDNFEIEKVPEILYQIGSEASLDSAKRHPTLFKFVSPGTGLEILKYIKMLWYTVFGSELQYEIINEEDFEESDYLEIYIDNCPICQGFYTDDLDFSPEEMKKVFGNSGYACILTGMMNSVGNFILEVKEIPYSMEIKEEMCIALGDKRMKISATLTPRSID